MTGGGSGRGKGGRGGKSRTAREIVFWPGARGKLSSREKSVLKSPIGGILSFCSTSPKSPARDRLPKPPQAAGNPSRNLSFRNLCQEKIALQSQYQKNCDQHKRDQFTRRPPTERILPFPCDVWKKPSLKPSRDPSRDPLPIDA